MSYDQILIPAGAGTTAAEADAYLETQQGEAESATVRAIAAELTKRNPELPEEDSFLSVTPLGGVQTGAVLYAASPYDAIGHLRRQLFELATPHDYAVYDPQLAWVIDPTDRIDLTVTHGGAGEFPYLTRALVDLWVPALSNPNPYLIAESGPDTYVQTFRNEAGGFTVEYRNGSPDKHFATQVADPQTAANLIWAWARGDSAQLESQQWQLVDFS